MSNKDKLIIDKVVYAKYLYQKAISELSVGTDLSASVAINLIHDAIEMIVIAVEDKLNIYKKEYNFKQRLKNIKNKKSLKQLPLEKQVEGINSARRSFKHDAQLQSVKNIKVLSIYAFDFMNQVSDELLGLDFENISLATLIIDKKVKGFIKESEKFITEKKYYNSITSSAKAYSTFFFQINDKEPKRQFFKNSDKWGWGNSELRDIVGDIQADNINNSFSELYHFAFLSMLDIDVQKYTKFDFLRPNIGTNYYGDFKINHVRSEENNKDNSFENAQFCIDFVLDVILKSQSKE